MEGRPPEGLRFETPEANGSERNDEDESQHRTGQENGARPPFEASGDQPKKPVDDEDSSRGVGQIDSKPAPYEKREVREWKGETEQADQKKLQG
jgi:hypothetical protein